jgi:tetratricopeptide (TPR) repeat protein
MIPQFGEDDILGRVGEKSFELGRRYFRQGAIFNARRQVSTLKAYCAGSRPEPYHVRVRFSSKGIEEAECSCPVGSGGRCKHVAALLFTWLHRPEGFREVEELDKALERRSKSELIWLIKQMLLRRPELEVFVEAPLPSSGRGKRRRRRPVDPEPYRCQAAAAFHCSGDYWDLEAQIARELEAIVAIGDGFAEESDWASAAAVYQGVSAEVLARYQTFPDEEGELASVVWRCVEGLGRCLAGTRDPEARERVLRALFEVYLSDVELGGVGLGDEVPEVVLAGATAEERRKLAGWVRSALPKAQRDEWSVEWRRKVLGRFLLQLEKDELDDEKFLEICRETGRLGELVDRLLALGKLEEAEAEVQGTVDSISNYELLELADIFKRHGHPEVAERLVVERSEATKDWKLLEWLISHYAAEGELAEALELALRLFELQPYLPRYQKVRELAERLGRWGELRQGVLEKLAAEGEHSLLVEIHLEEGEIDQALELLNRVGHPRPELIDAVACAAEVSRPREAIRLYELRVERLIELRGRENYREACRKLARMRELYRRLGEGNAWEGYIAALRERNRKLPAFQDELAKAGL